MKVKILEDETSYTFGDDMNFDTVFNVVTEDPHGVRLSGVDLLSAGAEHFDEDVDYGFSPKSFEVVDG